jgi:hypothetical protein
MGERASLVDDVSRRLARPLSRRDALTVIGAAVTGAALTRGVQPSQAVPKCFVRTYRSTGFTSGCAGCTSQGGLTCFGLNDCQSGCLQCETRDYCGKVIGLSACCPSCPDPCKPNQPCADFDAANNTVFDYCPNADDAPRECQYYSRKNECTGGKCSYYASLGPDNCKSPPPTTIDLSDAELACIRQCLQVKDANLPSDQLDADGCPNADPIADYHDTCFEFCGASRWRFPTDLFKYILYRHP